MQTRAYRDAPQGRISLAEPTGRIATGVGAFDCTGRLLKWAKDGGTAAESGIPFRGRGLTRTHGEVFRVH